jgi:hypothetical protein
VAEYDPSEVPREDALHGGPSSRLVAKPESETFVIGCAVLLFVVSCAGSRSESPKEQSRSPEATASEEARCEGTRTYHYKKRSVVFTTNDVPGCPKSGPLSGTEKREFLEGKDGADELRNLGGSDDLDGGSGSDILYGGPDDDYLLAGGAGDDVLYGGDGRDFLSGIDEGKDVLYGGDGNDNLDASSGGARQALLRCRTGQILFRQVRPCR